MGDWLGQAIANFLKQYRPFGEARAFARKLKLKNRSEWRAFCKGEMPRLGRLPKDIPTYPKTYCDRGWKSWVTGWGPAWSRQPKRYRPFPQARVFARKLKLKNQQ